MKKIIYILSVAACLLLCLSGCSKGIDYYSFVSEERTGIYIYEEDGLSFKIYASRKERPYASDGIKGDVSDVIELYLSLSSSADEVEVSIGELGGEMNYLAVSKSFYLSFSHEDFKTESVAVVLNIDGREKSFEALSVLYDGVINGKTALKCVTEYDKPLFESLTDGNTFSGEICIRLLFDEGCFFYVGVCSRSGEICAYLVDGESGRIIAQRTIQSAIN